MNSFTITAIATPSGRGGIGIIRISGDRAFSIAMSIFVPRPFRNTRLPESRFLPSQILSHHLYYGSIVHPETKSVLDEVLVVFMKAPHSYTREDVVEIQAHSGQAVLKAILNLVLGQGAELAGPGEFTRRAFLNGRIDLTQAEAVIDMINLKSEKALSALADHLSGAFGQHISEISGALRHILVKMEASIDFPDEVEDVQPLWLVPKLEYSILKPILSLIQQYEDGHVIRDGYHICIVGRPNVGKSSLMNWLVKKDRSIVTDIPGTTRDIVEESVVFRGIPVNFSDTAGVHITQDRVESLGIEKTFERIQGSDLVLLLMDASIADADLEKQLLDQTGSIPVILVVNKIDLAADQDNIVVDESFSSLPMVAVSVKNRIHLDALVDVMVQKILHKIQTHAPVAFIPNLRQVRAFEAAAAHVRQALKGIEQGSPLDIIAIDIRDTVNKIDEITGTQTTDAVLDDIFSAFCIGK